VFGTLLYDYGILCFLIGFIATYVGHVNVTYLMKKLQRNSIIAFCLGLVVLVSAILMTLESIIAIVSGQTGHSKGVCDAVSG
jgi:predicted PurR-regulated permease PerM